MVRQAHHERTTDPSANNRKALHGASTLIRIAHCV